MKQKKFEGCSSKYSAKKKYEIVRQFMDLKEKYLARERNDKSCREIDEEIAQQLGVDRTTICSWKKELGLTGMSFN